MSCGCLRFAFWLIHEPRMYSLQSRTTSIFMHKLGTLHLWEEEFTSYLFKYEEFTFKWFPQPLIVPPAESSLDCISWLRKVGSHVQIFCESDILVFLNILWRHLACITRLFRWAPCNSHSFQSCCCLKIGIESLQFLHQKHSWVLQYPAHGRAKERQGWWGVLTLGLTAH